MSTPTTTTPTSPDVRRALPRPAYFDTALRLCTDFAHWWAVAARPARGMAVGILTVIGVSALLVTWSLLTFLNWLAAGAVHLVGHDGVHALAAWQLTHVLTDPVRQYLATAGANLPASTSTLTVLWAVAAGLLWLASLLGVRGARIGWAAVGAATTALVWAGTPHPGQLVAAAIAVAAWALLSIPAYWRHQNRGVVVLDPEPRPEPQPSRPQPSNRREAR